MTQRNYFCVKCGKTIERDATRVPLVLAVPADDIVGALDRPRAFTYFEGVIFHRECAPELLQTIEGE